MSRKRVESRIFVLTQESWNELEEMGERLKVQDLLMRKQMANSIIHNAHRRQNEKWYHY